MSRYLQLEWGSLWTEALGNLNDPPLLLISGAGAHAHFWSDSFCALLVEAGYSVIRYDHRDVGLSDPSSANYGIGQLAADAIEVLNGYDLRSAHLVGHSMGGYIGQLLAAEFPERLLSLTAISAGPIGEPKTGFPPPNHNERIVLQETWREMLKNRPTQCFEESLEGYMGVWNRLNGEFPVDSEKARRYTEELFTRSRYPAGVHEKHVKAMEELSATMKERSHLFSKITVPTLIIQGAADYLVLPTRGGALLASCLPAADYHLIPSMGHMLFNEDVEKIVADTILTFLKTIPNQTSSP